MEHAKGGIRNNQMTEKFCIRVDASAKIGIGHVVRCLTLAEELRRCNIHLQFICRAHHGHLGDMISSKGFALTLLPAPSQPVETLLLEKDNYSEWLGVPQKEDALQTIAALGARQADWLIVDHYGLDHEWETILRPHTRQIMVIDDIANRKHDCDLLLDQNLFERSLKRYQGLVPNACKCLLGPWYALLRSDFSAWRTHSLAQRKVPNLDRLLVFMGGSDPSNETMKVMEGAELSRIRWQRIDVVVGHSYPWQIELKQKIDLWQLAELYVQTDNMAELLASADLAITGGGSVSWEKCVLGVPSLVEILGDNQAPIVSMMNKIGAQRSLGTGELITSENIAKVLDSLTPQDLTDMTIHSQEICDGLGIKRVIDEMMEFRWS